MLTKYRLLDEIFLADIDFCEPITYDNRAFSQSRKITIGGIMENQREKQIVAIVLVEIAEALKEGAGGPIDFWYKKLAERLEARAIKFLGDGRSIQR